MRIIKFNYNLNFNFFIVMEERKAKLTYLHTTGLIPRYRQYSALAQVIHNVPRVGKQLEQPLKESTTSLRLLTGKRIFTKVWTSPAVPLGLCLAHLYLIALFLRNPF